MLFSRTSYAPESVLKIETVTELIVSKFDTLHAALLARAALGRIQDAMSLTDEDIAVVSAGEKGQVRLFESVDACCELPRDTFWTVLIKLLSVAGDEEPDGVSRETTSAKLAAVGVDAESMLSFIEQVRAGFSALLVLVHGPAMRNQVLGVLRGFQGHISRNTLRGDDREAWLRALSDSPAEEDHQNAGLDYTDK